MAELESLNKSETEQVVKDSAAYHKEISSLKQKCEAANAKLKILENKVSHERAEHDQTGMYVHTTLH